MCVYVCKRERDRQTDITRDQGNGNVTTKAGLKAESDKPIPPWRPRL